MKRESAAVPSIVPPAATGDAGVNLPWLDRLARAIFFHLLGKIRQGHITVRENNNFWEFGKNTDIRPGAAQVNVHHPRFYRALLFQGSRGLGDSYIQGYWSSPDLTAVICLLTRNLQVLGRYFCPDKLAGPFCRLWWWSRRNTPTGSRKNIAAHYDLGNDFYALFLDETMAYSCGIFEETGSSLSEAQRVKYDRVCRKLDLQPSDHLLEIGTGWGGLAIHAARQYGCRVTTTTISQAQYDYARRLFQEIGLSGQITLLLQDYRHLQGKFDKLVSIEMIEAVGHEYLEEYFRVCGQRLQDRGLMLLQAIIIGDGIYSSYRRSTDFIRSHIFPGGHLVSVQAMGRAAARTTDLRLVHLEDLTPHYPLTLRAWRERFWAHLPAVRGMGYPEEFIRLWEFYLCYCEGGFRERYIGDVQVLYAKSGYRKPVFPYAESLH